MRIVIAGGSAAGLFTALLLARAGHDVVVLDRDPLEPAADVESAAAAAFRPAAPQIVSRTCSWPDAERLMPVMTRRSTVDWVLARTAAAEPRVEPGCGPSAPLVTREQLLAALSQ